MPSDGFQGWEFGSGWLWPSGEGGAGGVNPMGAGGIRTGSAGSIRERSHDPYRGVVTLIGGCQGGVIHRAGGVIPMETPHSPLCSFSCSFRCFLKLKDFPQVGSEQVKVFWCTCWYFWWCCQWKKKPISSQFQFQDTPPRLPSAPGSTGLSRCSHSGTGGWRRFCHSLQSHTGGSHALLPS